MHKQHTVVQYESPFALVAQGKNVRTTRMRGQSCVMWSLLAHAKFSDSIQKVDEQQSWHIVTLRS